MNLEDAKRVQAEVEEIFLTPITDWLGSPITEGSTIVYPVRGGSSLSMVLARVERVVRLLPDNERLTQKGHVQYGVLEDGSDDGKYSYRRLPLKNIAGYEIDWSKAAVLKVSRLRTTGYRGDDIGQRGATIHELDRVTVIPSP